MVLFGLTTDGEQANQKILDGDNKRAKILLGDIFRCKKYETIDETAP